MHTTFETGKEKIRNAISDIAERATSFEEFQRLLKAEYGISVKDHRGRFSYLPADRQKYISARALGSNYDRDRLLRIFAENARTAKQNNPHWTADDPLAILFIKSDLRLVVNLQTCVKAQQSRAYAQKVKISNLQQMARTITYVQEHGYDSYEKLSETAEAIYTKMAKARGDAKLTESKNVQEQRFVQLVCEQTKKQRPDIILHDSGVLVAQTIYGFDSSVMKKIEKFLREQKPELLHHQKFLENGTAERAKESGTEQNYNMIDGCVNNNPKKPRIIGNRISVLDRLHIKLEERKQKSQPQQQQQQERSRKN